MNSQATCKTCHRWLTTIATLLTGQCERCLLPESADPKLFYPYWRLVNPEKIPMVQSTLFEVQDE